MVFLLLITWYIWCMVLTSFFQYCEASSVLPDAEEVLRTLLATRKLNTVLLRGRRLCSVPHLIPRCVELCAGTTCTPQGECCTCCQIGCEECDNNYCNGAYDACHICNGPGFDSNGCCPQSPSDCAGVCSLPGEGSVDLGCGCNQPGPNPCCGGQQKSGCNNACGSSLVVDCAGEY